VFRATRRNRDGSFSTFADLAHASGDGESDAGANFECRTVALPAILGESLRADDAGVRDAMRWRMAFEALGRTHARAAAIAVLRLSRHRSAAIVWAPFRDQAEFCSFAELSTCAPYTLDAFYAWATDRGLLCKNAARVTVTSLHDAPDALFPGEPLPRRTESLA